MEAAVWLNEKEFNGGIVGYKTVSLRKSWKDDKGTWRDATINLRKGDVTKAIVLLQKVQEELLLNHEEEDNE